MAGSKQAAIPNVKIIEWGPGRESPASTRFLDRAAFAQSAELAAEQVLAGIRDRGDRAVSAFAKRFDGVRLAPSDFLVRRNEFDQAARQVDRAFKTAVSRVRKRVQSFAAMSRSRDWSTATEHGGRMGERFVPMDRVGVYVPAGKAPLVSTVLMTVVLARAAGVKEIVVSTPCRRDGAIDPFMLYAIQVSGATETYRIGGIQAIGMMAYGTETVRPVQKIVGPGNAYVTAAKRRVYGTVALDLVAGPSEIAVLADTGANARHVAADMLSQAEHGTGEERALLVTTSRALAARVQRELRIQAAESLRRAAMTRVMKRGMLIAVTRNVSDGIELCNRFAPEHLELMVRSPARYLNRVRSAGAVFLGPWSPESAGDFAIGPSHVLPTGGSSVRFSGLSVNDFLKRSSFASLSRGDLRQLLPMIEILGKVEGLDGHARAARIRFENERKRK